MSDPKIIAKGIKNSVKQLGSAISRSKIIIAELDNDLIYRWSINTPIDIKGTLTGRSDYDIFQKNDADKIVKIRKIVLKKGKGRRDRIKVRLKETDFYFDQVNEPIYKDNKIDGIISISIDVTKVVQAEKSLEKASEKLLSFLSDNPNSL